MLLDAILKLHDKIQNMKLGVNRDRQVTELEQARLRRLPLLAGVPGAHSGGAPAGPRAEHEPGAGQ
jgi:NADH-quinone oxidoreductase subunit B